MASRQGAVRPVPTTADAWSSPASPHVCSAVGDVNALRVTRTDANRHTHFLVPAPVTVRSPAARRVARALCRLTPVPRTAAYHCPDDDGLTYHLVFGLTSDEPAQPVTIPATGCRFAVNAGPAKTSRTTTGQFWETFGRALRMARRPARPSLDQARTSEIGAGARLVASTG